MSHADPLSYFAATPASPWQWSADGRVVVWYDGSTVAFREELAGILERLLPSGWPSFGSIVLLCAAIKGKVPDASWLLGDDPRSAPSSKRTHDTMRFALIHAALDGLSEMRSLSSQRLTEALKKNGKAILTEMLLERAPRVCSAEDARTLLSLLQGGVSEGVGFKPPSGYQASRLLNEVEILVEGWRGFDVESFELRSRTGLDTLVTAAPAAEELTPPEKARRLLSELSRDASLAGIARLARDLMAAIYLPHKVLPRDEAPSGGFADISHRGSLDRLLISELAHDDLTLAVRVALNEALYVRREPPEEAPEGCFSILLDSGLRLWGVPRVFGAAVALALVAVQSRKREVAVYRATGRRAVAVDLLSREGLVEHLSVVEPELDASAAIADFYERQRGAEHAEAVIVTHPDTVSDERFRAALRNDTVSGLYLASVERSGRFRLLSHPGLDGKALSDAVVDLDDVLPPSPSPSRPPILDDDYDSSLPVSFGVKPFPLLLPIRTKSSKILNAASSEGGEGACVTADGRLYIWREIGRGARQITTELPRGRPMGLFLEQDHAVVVTTHAGNVHIATVERDSGTCSTVQLNRRNLSHVRYHARTIHLILSERIEAVDPDSGDVVSRLETKDASWVRGRFFSRQGEWLVLVWDGARLALEPLAPVGIQGPNVLGAFDWDGHEGPLVVTKMNGVRSAAGKTLFPQTDYFVTLEGIASNGRRVLTHSSSRGYFKFDLAHGDVQNAAQVRDAWLGSTANRVPQRSLRHHMTHVAVLDGRRIGLRSRKGRWLELDPSEQGYLSLLDRGSEGEGLPNAARAFQPKSIPERHSCHLSSVSWQDGTVMFWDSRGLLHLKSSDPTLAEISLVLGDGEVAAWTSAGTYCGTQFFTDGAHREETASELWARLHRILERLS